MTKYTVEITADAADCIVRDVIRSSIETLFEAATEDATAHQARMFLADAAFLIEAHNYFSDPDQYLSLEDFEAKL
jgi:hypothetical protein